MSYPDRPPRQPDLVLKTRRFSVERKDVEVSLCENAQGRFLRIVEFCNNRRNSIIIPALGFAEFQQAVDEVIT